MRGQAPDDDRGGAFDIAIARTNPDACQVANNEVDGLSVSLGLQQVAKERQHVVQLPPGESIVGIEEILVAEVFRVQLVTACNGTTELFCGGFSLRLRHTNAILEGCRVRAPFVIARMTGPGHSLPERQRLEQGTSSARSNQDPKAPPPPPESAATSLASRTLGEK